MSLGMGPVEVIVCRQLSAASFETKRLAGHAGRGTKNK